MSSTTPVGPGRIVGSGRSRSWRRPRPGGPARVEFGGDRGFTYVMMGLARPIDRPLERPLERLGGWLDVAATSGMPVDPRLWLEAPPASILLAWPRRRPMSRVSPSPTCGPCVRVSRCAGASVEEALRQLGPLATPEVAASAGSPGRGPRRRGARWGWLRGGFAALPGGRSPRSPSPAADRGKCGRFAAKIRHNPPHLTIRRRVLRDRANSCSGSWRCSGERDRRRGWGSDVVGRLTPGSS